MAALSAALCIDVFESAVVLANGERLGSRTKSLLPTYDIFDEKRHFVPGEEHEPLSIPGLDLRVAERLLATAGAAAAAVAHYQHQHRYSAGKWSDDATGVAQR